MSTSGATVMQSPFKKPQSSVTLKKKKAALPLPSERQILDTLYSHYGKPENIVKEKVKLYLSYRSPAGWSQGDWVEDGFQMGRVNIFTSHDSKSNDLVKETKIDNSWFIGVSENKIKVFVHGKLEVTLDVEV